MKRAASKNAVETVASRWLRQHTLRETRVCVPLTNRRVGADELLDPIRQLAIARGAVAPAAEEAESVERPDPLGCVAIVLAPAVAKSRSC